MWEKIKRYQDSLKNESDPNVVRDLKAIISGMLNYHLGISKLGKERFEKYCKDCAYNVLDPVPEMRVMDEKIPELAGRMCAYCGGCVLSWKVRQSIKPCEFWK